MMIKTKIILALALMPVLGMLTACQADDAQLDDGRVPITLSDNTLTAVYTRAAADTTLNKGYLESGQNVKVLVRNHGATDWSEYTYTAGANGTMLLPDNPPYYPLDGTHVDIVACHPSFSGNTFTVATDQASNAGYLASDLLMASIDNQEKTTSTVNLQFEHKMAKVIVNVFANTSTGVTAIQNVTLQNVKPSVSVYPKTGVVSAADGTPTAITLVKNSTADNAAGAAVIPAQTISGNLLTIQTNLGIATYSVDSKEFEAGKSYVLTISVNQAAVGTTTAINGWTATEGAVVKTGDDRVKIFMVDDPQWPGWFTTITMIKVEGGTYSTLAGVTVNGTISDFYISQTEVTNFQWYAITGTTPPSGITAQIMRCHPIEKVSYNDIVSYQFFTKLNSKLANQLDGMTFKLPTEAQWEYAARGGKNHDTYTYSGSNIAADVAWGDANSAVDNVKQSHPVITRGANSLCIHDMTGNVWEMCRDKYQEGIPTTQNNYVCTTGSNHVYRGGGYLSPVEWLALTRRYSWADNTRNSAVGFRIVLDDMQ